MPKGTELAWKYVESEVKLIIPLPKLILVHFDHQYLKSWYPHTVQFICTLTPSPSFKSYSQDVYEKESQSNNLNVPNASCSQLAHQPVQITIHQTLTISAVTSYIPVLGRS